MHVIACTVFKAYGSTLLLSAHALLFPCDYRIACPAQSSTKQWASVCPPCARHTARQCTITAVVHYLRKTGTMKAAARLQGRMRGSQSSLRERHVLASSGKHWVPRRCFVCVKSYAAHSGLRPAKACKMVRNLANHGARVSAGPKNLSAHDAHSHPGHDGMGIELTEWPKRTPPYVLLGHDSVGQSQKKSAKA